MSDPGLMVGRDVQSLATLDADWTRLVDRGCYDAWSKQLG